MKKLIALGVVTLLFACGSPKNSDGNSDNSATAKRDVSEYDPTRGEGEYENIELGSLDANLAAKGKEVYEIKCQSCHKLTDERLVGPGWDGVSDKHKPEWILNFITNPDPMIDKDPELQAQLELCLVRMPNQNVSEEEAFALLEFMRQNDGVN